MALLRYFETTRKSLNEITRASGNIINCTDSGEVFYDATDNIRFITTHIKIFQTLNDLNLTNIDNKHPDPNVIYVVTENRRFYIYDSISGEFESILSQDDAAEFINRWVGAIPAAIVKNNKRYAPMTIAKSVYTQDGDTVENKLNQLGVMTSSFENIQVTQYGKTFDIPVPFRDFFDVPHCMIVCIGTTMITPNRYSVKNNKITFLENIDIGRTINFFFMYTTKTHGNKITVDNIDGSSINRGTIQSDKLAKTSGSYLLNDSTSIATSAGLKGIYDLVAALCNEKNITVRCRASKVDEDKYELHMPNNFIDVLDGDIFCIKFDSDVSENAKITYKGKSYPIYTSSTTPIKENEICENDELYFQYNSTDGRFYVTNGMAYRIDQFNYNKVIDTETNIFSYDETTFLPGYDTLTVYLNGLRLIKKINYNINYKTKTITLNGFNARPGDTVEFVVDRINRTRATRNAASVDFLDMKEVKKIAADATNTLKLSVDSLIEKANEKIKNLQQASGEIKKTIDEQLDSYATKKYVGDELTNSLDEFNKKIDEIKNDNKSFHNDVNSSIDEKINKLESSKNEIILSCYPVGSIYMSVLSTNPHDLFGGEWTELPPGRCLMGEGMSSYGVKFENGTMGGDDSHIIKENELPSFKISGQTNFINDHQHLGWGENKWKITQAPYGFVDDVTGKYIGSASTDFDNYLMKSSPAGGHSHEINIDSVHENKPFKIIPPYFVVYMWRRVL